MNKTHDAPIRPLLLTRSQVARLLATSDRHVRRLTEDGRLPSVRIEARQLDEYVERLRRPSTAAVGVLNGPQETSGDQPAITPGTIPPLPLKDK